MVFMGINHSLRTDDEYARLDDEDHHKGPSSLSRLPMSMVSQVPIEYMHLICIGVVKVIDCMDYWKVWKKNEIVWSKPKHDFEKISIFYTVLPARICEKAKTTG